MKTAFYNLILHMNIYSVRFVHTSLKREVRGYPRTIFLNVPVGYWSWMK